MKMYYITNARIPTEKAHGIQIMNMCHAFSNLDVSVELLLPRRYNVLKQDPFNFYQIQRTFSIRKLFVIDLLRFDRFFGRFGFFIEEVTFLISIFFFLCQHRTKSDIVYTRDWYMGLISRTFALELHTLPRRMRWFHTYCLKRAKKIYTITNNLKKDLERIGIPSDHIVVAPDGVDVDRFTVPLSKTECRTKIGLPQEKKIVLYAGSLFLHAWKGVDVLIEASEYLPSEYAVVLVGGSEHEISNLKKKYTEHPQVIYVRRQSHTVIPYYISAADVVVLPNKQGDIISEKYTSPLKLFEYMASGTPIIASDLSSIKEVLQHKKNAYLVSSDNPIVLAEGIRHLMEDTKQRYEFARQARIDVQGYTWHARATSIMKCLAQMTWYIF